MDKDQKTAMLEAFYKAIMSGDGAGIMAPLHPDFVAVEADGLPYGGTTQGVGAFMTLLGELSTTYSEFGVDGFKFFVEGDTAMALMTLRGKVAKTGAPIEMPVIEYWEFRDDKLAYVRPHYFDTHAIWVAFGGD